MAGSEKRGSKAPLIFISHNHRDADLAAAFSKLLDDVSVGVLQSFRSSDRMGSQGIDYGAAWHDVLMSKLESATDVVCLITARSLDQPWILYEAGVAKGKLNTPVYGIALGIPLRRACTGPFAQFQNCDDDEQSLTAFVLQLLRNRKPGSQPDKRTIRKRVRAFKEKADKVLFEPVGLKDMKKNEPAAKLFLEQIEFQAGPLTSKDDEWRKQLKGYWEMYHVAISDRSSRVSLSLLHITVDKDHVMRYEVTDNCITHEGKRQPYFSYGGVAVPVNHFLLFIGEAGHGGSFEAMGCERPFGAYQKNLVIQGVILGISGGVVEQRLIGPAATRFIMRRLGDTAAEAMEKCIVNVNGADRSTNGDEETCAQWLRERIGGYLDELGPTKDLDGKVRELLREGQVVGTTVVMKYLKDLNRRNSALPPSSAAISRHPT